MKSNDVVGTLFCHINYYCLFMKNNVGYKIGRSVLEEFCYNHFDWRILQIPIGIPIILRNVYKKIVKAVTSYT